MRAAHLPLRADPGWTARGRFGADRKWKVPALRPGGVSRVQREDRHAATTHSRDRHHHRGPRPTHRRRRHSRDAVERRDGHPADAPAREQRHRAQGRRLLRKMTVDEKLQQLQLLSDGQITDADARGRRRRGLQPHRSGQDRPLPARRRRAVAAPHPDPVRVRHDPRLPHGVPDPAGSGEQLRSVRRHRGRHRRCARVGDRRHQADLQPHGRRLARAALGPHRRGRGRGSVPRRRLRRGPRQGRAGRRLLRARQGRRERQALRRLRPARGRARVQHDRHVRVAAAQPLPAAFQGRDRRGRRHRHVLVQRHQRRAWLRELRRSRPTS